MNTKKTRLYVLDTQQIKRFTQRIKEKLGIPESILEEQSLESSNGIAIGRGTEMTPHKEYKNAEGYEFSWGTILERRADAYIVWDYCLNQLLTHYLRKGKRLNDMQRAVFYELEHTIDHTTRDIIDVIGMTKGWKFLPCSSVGAFTQIIHFTSEKEAKDWTVDCLLHQTLPEIIARLMQDEPRSILR